MPPDWITPALVSAFAAVVWYLAKRIMARQDELAEKHQQTSEETRRLLEQIQSYLQSELRNFDVRLSVVETLILPQKK